MSKKEPIKMRRVDASEVSADEEQSPTEAVKFAMDTVVVVEKDVQEIAAEEVSQSSSPVISKNSSGVVTLEQDDMEEVSYNDYVKMTESALTSKNSNQEMSAKQKILDLIGKSADYVKDALESMVREKAIVEYRFVPIGMPATMEVAPGRVQVLIDSTKRVIDVQIS